MRNETSTIQKFERVLNRTDSGLMRPILYTLLLTTNEKPEKSES